MCIIVGVVGKAKRDVSKTALQLLRTAHGESSDFRNLVVNSQGEYLVADNMRVIEDSISSSSTAVLGTACSCEKRKHCMASKDPRLGSVAMIGSIFNMPDAPASLIGKFEDNIGRTENLESAAKNLLKSLDGQYALALRRDDTFLLARDPIGVKPLYFAENDHMFVFSSRRRPLWEAGLTDIRALPQPLIIVDGKVTRITHGIKMGSIKSEKNSLTDSLVLLLTNAVKKMTASAGRNVGILFSGGLDSSIISKLSKDLGIKCTLYCAGTSSSRDMISARRVAAALGLQLVEKNITSDEATNYLLPVVKSIESFEMIAVSTSLPIYLATREAVRSGEHIILHGQGADELFGGYERYEAKLVSSGYAALCREMLNDIVGLGNTMPQFDQIGTMNSAILLAPFLDASVVEFSLGIPPQMKLFKGMATISRKHILRQAASRIGIAVDILPKRKVAVQFGSGVAKILDKASRTAGFTKRIAKDMGFPLPVQAYLKEVGKLAGIPL